MRSSFRIPSFLVLRPPSGHRRRSLTRRLAAGLASTLALLVAVSGLVLATAAPAGATIQQFQVDCSGLSIQIEQFPDGEPNLNSIRIIIDRKIVQDTTFSASFSATEAFSDPTVPHRYEVRVVAAWDEPDANGNGPKGWSRTYQGTSPVCPKPTVTVQAEVCTVENGSTAIRASVDSLDAARSYTATLTSGGSSIASQTISGVTNASLDFGPRPPGATYTVTVTDQANGSLTGSATVTARACPKVGGVSYEIQQCTTPGGQGGIVFTSSDLVVGNVYELRSGSTTGPVLGSFVYTAGQTRYVVPLPAGQSYQVYLVDQQGNLLQVGPLSFDLAVCPSLPVVVSVTAAPCVLNATGSDLAVRLGDLTIGRSYQLVYDGAPYGTPFTASANTAEMTITNASPGPHSVQVTDTLASVTSASASVTVAQCASLPTVTIGVRECAAPDQSGDLSATIGGLTAGRSYQVTLTSGGTPVATYPSSTFVASGATSTVDYPGLTPGGSYRVSVVDTADARATASATVTLAACPPVPTLTALIASCNAGAGTSVIRAAVGTVAAGQIWRVQLLKADASGTYLPIVDRPDLNPLDSSALTFADVQNGGSYRVTLASQTTPALAAQASVTAARCSVSAAEYTQDPGTPAVSASALARTGTDAFAPAVVALIVLQLGVALVVIAAIRRRRMAED